MRGNRGVIVGAVLILGIVCVGGEKSKKPVSAIRLTQPWSRLNDLSDEQKVKMDGIHRKAREEIKAIEKREREEMLAVLTPQQQAELREMEDQDTADKKLKAGEKNRINATTEPTP